MQDMARENEKIPTSRARRTATVATLAASEAVKQFGTRAANVTRGEEASEEAMARRQLETAKQIVAVLGTMKGAAMKLGQVMSFLDVGLVPEEHREEFQQELAKLRDAAPTVSFKQMRRVIEEDLEEPIAEVFASFEEEPIAAASIGQVYRATLHDGREVAVKVQYPGVAGAVRADMQNLDMILRLLKRMTPALDVKAIAEEIKERIVEELDYELEAQNQRSLARIFAGHPFIVVPDVVSSLSRERVLVSDYVEGVGFEELKGRSQAERNRIGEIIFRFFLGCLYRHRQFSGDPHPGNFLALDDGRVAFLDFGLFKRLDAEPVELELAAQRAVTEGDAAKLHELLGASGFLPEPERVDPEQPAGVHQGCDLVVHDRRRRGPALARDRHAGDDRELRPALQPLPRDAPSDDPPRAPVRPAHGDAHARRALAAARQRQLAPDRPRVDVRRRSRHRARPRGGRVLRSQRRRRALKRRVVRASRCGPAPLRTRCSSSRACAPPGAGRPWRERRACLRDVRAERLYERLPERLLDEHAHDLHVFRVRRQRVRGDHPAALRRELRGDVELVVGVLARQFERDQRQLLVLLAADQLEVPAPL